MGVWWQNVISNEELLRRTNTETIAWRWRWIGHTLKRDSNNVARQALNYQPQGKRIVRRPRNNWKRSLLMELKRVGYCWERAKALAKKTVCVGGHW